MWVDSHVHVFDEDSAEYPWDLQATMRPGYHAPASELIQEMQAVEVDKAVIVQHSCYGYDNRYIIDCAQRYPEKLCAVVKVDPLAEEAPSQLEQLARYDLVRGLRLQPVSQPESSWLADEKTYPLWEICAHHNLVIGILLDPHQLPMAEAIIHQFPSVKVIIDHMSRLKADTPLWKEALQRLCHLSTIDNVFVKLSGFYALSQQPYPYEDLNPQVRELYEAFGATRLMWATDFPLLIRAGETYPQATEILIHHLPVLSSDQHEWIMGKTAATLFGWS